MSKKMFGEIMRQAQKIQEQIQKKQEEIKRMTVEATAGGGMVTAQANGAGEIISIKIDKEVVNPDDVEMLEDLILAAVNEALKRAHELAQAEMAKVSMPFNLPGMPDLTSLFGKL
ncbi:YbaB/EbfC family nucleoid-associated protein [Thermodesulfovibrio sp. 3907-1M]|uniref:Nucleoid-associated protein V4D30_02920 n=1 Tax=Thermodesulfovibrio autotrophicus TaxID=3118333 RepID=A0AAU8H163_9BACT